MLPAPRIGAASVLTGRSAQGIAERLGPVLSIFSPSGFHRLFATKPVRSETHKQAERLSGGNHGSIRDSWPIAMSGYPRGPIVALRLRCTRHAGPNDLVETHPRTQVSRTGLATAREVPQQRNGRGSETLKRVTTRLRTESEPAGARER